MNNRKAELLKAISRFARVDRVTHCYIDDDNVVVKLVPGEIEPSSKEEGRAEGKKPKGTFMCYVDKLSREPKVGDKLIVDDDSGKATGYA
jgi:hypothetical protein